MQYLLYHVSKIRSSDIFHRSDSFFICNGVYNKNGKYILKKKRKKNPITASISLLLVFSVQCNEKCICRRLTILFVLLLNYFF